PRPPEVPGSQTPTGGQRARHDGGTRSTIAGTLSTTADALGATAHPDSSGTQLSAPLGCPRPPQRPRTVRQACANIASSAANRCSNLVPLGKAPAGNSL